MFESHDLTMTEPAELTPLSFPPSRPVSASAADDVGPPPDAPGAEPSADPTLSTEALEAELVGLAGHLAAGHYRWLRLLAEFDTREGWAGPGLRSCAHWLSWRVGMSLRTGFEQLRVAHSLRTLPEVSAAFAAGRVSYSKVRAITRVATPETERTLLDIALGGTAGHLERVVRHARQAGSDPVAAHARRHLDWRWEDDGTLVVSGRFTAEQGARLLGALDKATHRDDTSGRQPAEPLAARRADALVEMVTGGRPINAEVLVVLDADPEGSIDRAPRAMVPGGPALPMRSAERIGCSARVRALLRDRAGNPLCLGRSRRLASRAQSTALRVRDQGRCRFPGCEQRRHLDSHHIVPWSRGGTTDVDNLVLLCDHHHRLVHEHGYRMRGRGTEVTFHDPDGRPIGAVGAPGGGDADALVTGQSDLGITDDSLTPDWAGDRMDLSAVLSALLEEPPTARAA